MDRKRSFQARFERAKTPMGAVPISVIMGFDYPLGDTEPCGRGEASSSSSYSYSCKPSYTSSYTSSYPSTLTSNYSNYRDTNMLERIPRPPTQRTAAATPAYRTPGQRQYLGRAGTELRDTRETTPGYNYSPSSALEHPKQQPCHYATALSLSSTPLPSRQSRARTVAPSTPSPWRQTTFLSRPAASSHPSPYSGQASSSYNRFSSVRSRFM